MKRPRGRGRRNNNSNHNNPNKHFESNGPDVRIRGSAQQILDKYMQYARDAHTSGDRIHAENYFQHAEHYLRVLAKLQPKEKPKPPQQDGETTQEAGQANASDDNTTKAEAPDQKESGRRPRRPRQDAQTAKSDDPLKVIDGDKAEAGTETKADAPVEDAPKPRRRRTYKKRETSEGDMPAAEPIEDGVMKTLSRGRRKPAAAKAHAAPEGDTSTEAAD
jgi:hypothetical protein